MAYLKLVDEFKSSTQMQHLTTLVKKRSSTTKVFRIEVHVGIHVWNGATMKQFERILEEIL